MADKTQQRATLSKIWQPTSRPKPDANVIITELARYLMQDADASPSVTRWEQLAEDRVRRWFSK